MPYLGTSVHGILIWCLQVSVSWTSYSSARLLGRSYIHMFISKLCKDVAMVHIKEGF